MPDLLQDKSTVHLLFCDFWSYNTEKMGVFISFFKLTWFCYCQLDYPADRTRNPVFVNKYGSLKTHWEAFVDCQQYIRTFKVSPKQFSG